MLETALEQEKNPFFKFIRPDFWTDLNGCRQRLLFVRQLTQRKMYHLLAGYVTNFAYKVKPLRLAVACDTKVVMILSLDRTAQTSSCWLTPIGQAIIIEAPSN